MSADRSNTERIRRLKGITIFNGPQTKGEAYDTYLSQKFGKTPYYAQIATGASVEDSCCKCSTVLAPVVTATNGSTYDVVELSWTTQTIPNVPITYEVTYSPVIVGASITYIGTSRAQVTGLITGNLYTFTVTALSTCGTASGTTSFQMQNIPQEPSTQVTPTFLSISGTGNYDIAYNAFTDTWIGVGRERFTTVGLSAIFKSVGGAYSWEPIPSALGLLYCITYIPNTALWIVGGNNIIIRSTDNGATWNNDIIPFSSNVVIQSIAVNPSNAQLIVGGYIGAYTASLLWVSTTYGVWQAVSPPANTTAINSVVYDLTTSRWFLGGATSSSSAIYISNENPDLTNITWSYIGNGSAFLGYPIRFLSILQNTLYVVGNNDGTSAFYTASISDIVANPATAVLTPFATTIFPTGSYAYSLVPTLLNTQIGYIAGGYTGTSVCAYVNTTGTWNPVTSTTPFSSTFTVRKIYAGSKNWIAIGDDTSGSLAYCIYVGTYVP